MKNNKIKIADIEIAQRVSLTDLEYASPEMINYTVIPCFAMGEAKIIEDYLVTKKTDIWFISFFLYYFDHV